MGRFVFLVANLDTAKYHGRLALGRIFSGTLHRGDEVALAKINGSLQPTRITKLYGFKGLERIDLETAEVGDIVAIAGVEGITIGETVTSQQDPSPLPHIPSDEPTLSKGVTSNTSPVSGQDGANVTSRHLRERLDKELLTNVSIRVDALDNTDSFKVMVAAANFSWPFWIEMMRREGLRAGGGVQDRAGWRAHRQRQTAGAAGTAHYRRAAGLCRRADAGNRHAQGNQHQDCEPQRGARRKRPRAPGVHHPVARAHRAAAVKALKQRWHQAVMNTLLAGYIEWQGDIPSR